jgi:trigger factor
VSSTLKTLDPTQVELEISISTEEFDAAQDAAFRALVRRVKMPGFRPGKVPRKIFENAYGTSGIVERALDDLVPTKYAAAVEEHHLEPVARPQMELLPEAEGQPLRVKAIVPIRPAIDPQGYQGVEITEVPESATDDDVERTLEQMRRDAATLVPVDRPAQLGDVVTIDYAGSIDGVPFDGGTATGQETELDESRFVPGFVAGIVGMTAGESKDVTADFPAEYGNEELAGKQAVFAITLHDVKERELPPLDDEFAKRVSQLQTLDELRADVKRRLDEQVKSNARRRMSSDLLEKVVAANEIPLPAVLVERELDSLVTDMQQMVARAGISWDDYLAQSGKSEQEARDGYREEAERRVKTTLLVEAIAKKEGIVATQADVEGELDALSAQYGQPRERIVEALQSNIGALVDGIVRTKTIERMIEQAKRVPATETAST